MSKYIVHWVLIKVCGMMAGTYRIRTSSSEEPISSIGKIPVVTPFNYSNKGELSPTPIACQHQYFQAPTLWITIGNTNRNRSMNNIIDK